MTHTFNTTEYQLAHGKQPKGIGFGVWAFSHNNLVYFFNCTYKEAKRKMAAELNEQGLTYQTVKVLS